MLVRDIDQRVYQWMEEVDSIYTPEISRKWNEYVDSAFKPRKRRITIGMVLKVLFARPYNPVKYTYRKDNELVSDLFWKADKNEKPFEQMKINYPLLIISGRYDDVAPPEEMKVIHEFVAHSQLVIIPDAGHESFLDQPEFFNQSILQFVNLESN